MKKQYFSGKLTIEVIKVTDTNGKTLYRIEGITTESKCIIQLTTDKNISSVSYEWKKPNAYRNIEFTNEEIKEVYDVGIILIEQTA